MEFPTLGVEPHKAPGGKVHLAWHEQGRQTWAHPCLNCQRNKMQRYNKFPPGSFPDPNARFSHVHLDIVAHLPPSTVYTHLLSCVDRYTRWGGAITLPDVQAETVVKALFSR
ncbi:hypothetical protein SprV_0401563200 [Sparganum proliferum]